MNPRILIVTTMKNEGPYILEWVAFHRAAGVTKFIVYTNDCADETVAMLDRLTELGVVERRDNPFKPGGAIKPQHAALKDASARDLAEADWAMTIDVDEFINIHVGGGRFADLFAALPPDVALISMTWRLFGNDGVRAFDDRFVTEQFLRAAPERCPKPHQAWGFKTMARQPMGFEKLGVHRPVKPVEDAAPGLWLNGSGEPMPDSVIKNGWRSNKRSYGYRLVSLNHYAVRSAEGFLVKRDRGRVNHTDRDQGVAYWFRMNHNAEREMSILAKLPRAREEHAKLMADPVLARLHADSVAWHRNRAAKLMKRRDYRDLFEEITSERLETLSRNLDGFGRDIFLNGPDTVPQERLRELGLA